MISTKQAVFQIGNEEYGLDIMNVSTIEKDFRIEQTAKLPRNVKGIIRLRGEVLPVYSLRRKFGLADIEQDLDTRLIITKSNGMQIAYEVDKMKGITNLEEEQINEVPSIVKSKDTSYMKQVTDLDGKLIILMDCDHILTEEEQNTLKTTIKK